MKKVRILQVFCILLLLAGVAGFLYLLLAPPNQSYIYSKTASGEWELYQTLVSSGFVWYIYLYPLGAILLAAVGWVVSLVWGKKIKLSLQKDMQA